MRILVLNPVAAPAAALAVLVAAAACNRSFDNPAERLRAGEVSGRALLPGGVAASGVSVSLRGSAMDQATRPSGRFSLLPLPRGHHVVLLRQGQDRALLREVSVGYGAGGQLEGVSLGDLTLPSAAALSGTLQSLASSGNQGVVVDEATGIAVAVDDSLAFRFDGVPIGTHRLLAVTTDGVDYWLAGPTGITITADEAGTDKIVAPMPLRAVTPGTGQLRFRVTSIATGLASGDVPVTLENAAGGSVTVPPADSNGDRDFTVPEGLYYLQVGDPASTEVPAPPRRAAVVPSSDVADLGTFVIASQDTVDAAQLACHAGADCGPAPASCVAGTCAGYSAPAFSPASLPLCADLAECWVVGACGIPGAAGQCTALDPSSSACLPCGTGCTVDGASSVYPSCP